MLACGGGEDAGPRGNGSGTGATSGGRQFANGMLACYVDPKVIEYSVRMVTGTRRPRELGLKDLEHYITFGASPRASINLILTAKALAFVRGRNYVLPQDVLDMALDVMRHRLVLSYEALSDNVTPDSILKKIVDRVPVPVVPLKEHFNVSVTA